MTNLAVKPSPDNSLENDELPGQSQNFLDSLRTSWTVSELPGQSQNFLDNDQGVMTSSSMHRL